MAKDKFQDNETDDVVDKNTKPGEKKKITGKSGDPSKYVELEPTLGNNLYSVSESAESTMVLTFGRFSPPTIGHEKLVNKVIDEASKRKAKASVFLSHTQDKKKNPLSYDEKLEFMSDAFGRIVKKTPARTLIEVLKDLQSAYNKVVVVVGADRVPEFTTLLNKYNGKEFKFDNIDVISAGERDPDADDVTGMSASKMRALAVDNDVEGFTRGLPKKLKAKAKEVFDAVRRGMKLMEDLEEENLDESVKKLDFRARLKRSQTMKRYAGKMERARERALLRRSNPEKIRMKARKRALSILRKRLAGKRNYADLSTSEKMMIDQRASRFSDAMIDRVARKQIGVVRKIETDRLSHHHASHGIQTGVNVSKNEHFEMFVENYGDESAKKKFHNMYRKEGNVKTDGRFRFFRKKINESAESLNEDVFSLMEAVEEMYGESSDFAKQIAGMETKHKEINDALKDFSKKLDDAPDKKSKVELAKEIIAKHSLSFNPRQLVNLHGRIKNSEAYKKAYNNIDAFESVDAPSKREWGTQSLTKTYKGDTPGQEDADINEMFELMTEKNGLWANIRARRKKGLRPKRPGEEGYPKTLKIEDATTKSFKDIKQRVAQLKNRKPVEGEEE